MASRPPFEPFGARFTQALAARQFTVRSFAQRVGVKPKSWSFIQQVRKDQRPPPLDSLDVWCDALGLSGEEREAFIDAAYWAHVPQQVRPWIRRRMMTKGGGR